MAFVKRMRVGDPYDPLLLQVLIRGDEAVETVGYIHDPLAEQEANPLPGLLHKYAHSTSKCNTLGSIFGIKNLKGCAVF